MQPIDTKVEEKATSDTSSPLLPPPVPKKSFTTMVRGMYNSIPIHSIHPSAPPLTPKPSVANIQMPQSSPIVVVESVPTTTSIPTPSSWSFNVK
jgi:hypothetical protein